MQKTGGSASAGGNGANSGSGAQVYSFPLLKPSEIFACVREMQIPVSEDEIRNCEVGAIRKVLEVFIENIMGVTREEMNQPAFAGLSALSYPELHEESVPELTFFRTATKLLNACGVYDFGLKDIISPTPKRVRRQFSALINFAKFREERLAAFSELTRETDHLLKKKTTLQEENEQLQRQLNDLLQEHEAEAPAIKQITEETAQLETEINVLNKRQAVMRHETSELKNKNNELRDEMTSYQFNILEAEKEIERLRGKIVNSPERVKKEIEGIAVSLEDAKEELNAMERRHRELLAYSDTFARAEKDMLKTIELMREAEQDIQKCKDAKEQVKMQKKEIEENQRKTIEIIAQRKRMEKLVEQKRELFERYKEESRIKDQAADQALKSAQEELNQLESANSGIRQRITANKDASREVERKMREDELRYQKELHEIQQIRGFGKLSAGTTQESIKPGILEFAMKAKTQCGFERNCKQASAHSLLIRRKGRRIGRAAMADEMTPPGSPGKGGNVEVLDSILDENDTYDKHQLVRPLQKWEISRDHLVFSEICGLDTGKRHIIHFLEPRSEGVHGGILLTAVGNTVQILTLAPLSADEKKRSDISRAVLERRYLFGFGGGGIGSLAVHPSKQFFAVGEKGIKPNISIYRYPSAKVCRVLRNGTERSYSSVVFSQDGEKLASVGGAPDYLLTVWSWRQQQTILRCKAFGQDVFSVQFAPNDSGFLTTSGVGHIRMWKMASTFTGLKLQGDIGKFGKSELSDIEAFCVLPDKKVLSGTERGVLLLWDGNFIKCEIMTSRRQFPHGGAINVVDYDAAEDHIVTAGKDGCVNFWNFDSIDRADIPPDDTVALVSVKKQILIQPQMDIRSVIKESKSRYLIQDGQGSVHLLAIEGEEFYVTLDYLPNDTGRMTGIACSPYEHIAASCGDDGSVRAWDYVNQRYLFGTMASSSATGPSENGTNQSALPAAATGIAWVPSSGALITEQVAKSRQVAVGFSDGLVRVFLMDLTKRIWVRTNVFKPHRERVTCLTYSTSGIYFASASDDSTIFIFKIVPNYKTSKFSKHPPEYEPLGFQRVTCAVRSLCWRPDDAALLITLADGKVIEFFIPEGGLEPKGSRGAEASSRVDDAAGAQENESYELHLESREYSPFQRNRLMTVKELEVLEALNPSGNPQVEEKIHNNFQVEVRAASPFAWTALYASNDTIYLSCQSPFHGALYMCQCGNPVPLQEFASEETSHITGVALSTSKKFLLCGLSNGKFQLRSASRPHAYLTGEFHDYSASNSSGSSGRLQIAMSFEDSFVLSAGCDGNLSICRLHSEKMEFAAVTLGERCEKLQEEARIVGDQAMETQKTQIDVLQKALADGKNNGDDTGSMASPANALGNELTSLPSFHRVKAYTNYMESKLEDSGDAPSVAKDEETFQGVVRLVSDSSSTMGLAKAVSPLDDGEAPAGSLLNLLEVPDIQNPTEAYTIEDAKRKSEADAKANTTKSKQDRTRDVVNYMRKQLLELKALDATYPPENRLDDDEWEIDLDYGDLLTKMGDAACEEVRKELAYAVEREELLLMKMRETYVNPLAVELITLHAFESGLSVQSFRTMKMPAVLQKRLNDIHMSDPSEARRAPKKATAHTMATSESTGANNRSTTISGGELRKPSVLHILAKHVPLDDEFPLNEEERRMIQSGSMKSNADQDTPTGSNRDSLAKSPPGAPVSLHGAPAASGSVHGFEARKRLRADRKDRLTHWMSSKPGEDADDPRDIVAIAFSQRNMGDYKLKTAPNYVVPEDQRVNAAKKRRQMALLEEKLYEARLSFNAKVLELRELKLLLINELKQDQARLDGLYEALAMEEHIAQKKALEVDLGEWPEQRERVSDADIDIFLREKRVQPHSVAAGFLQSRERVESISGGSDERNGAAKTKASMDRSIASLSRKLHGASDTGSSVAKAGSSSETLVVRHIHLDDLSPVPSHSFTNISNKDASLKQKNLDADDAAVRVYLMKQEILKIERKKQDEIGAFDDAIAHLRREKMKLEVIFKKCELQLFTLLSELVLLEQFENKENLLSSKLEKSKGEKAQIVAEINEIQEHLSSKKKEHEEWSKQEKAIQSEFLTTVNGNGSTQHPNFAALQKIFKKKIKRPKKKNAGPNSGGKDGKESADSDSSGPSRENENADDDEEEDDEEDEEDDYDEDDDDDDDDEDDVCPTGCDLQLYEKVLAVREKRADVDDAMSDLTKAMEELKKSNERQVAKQRQIDKELQATEHDIQQFQSEKQTRFNQLDVVVALSKRQIRCLESRPGGKWRVPEQSESCLVFSMRSFEHLAERIDSLQKENKSLRQKFKDLHKQQNMLAKDKKVQQETIAEIQHRCEQLQLLKFGQLVDIEVLDKACDTTKLNDLQSKVRVKEIEGEREVLKVKQSQQQLKLQILHATEQNTALLSRIAELNERQFALEKELNQANVSQSVLHDDTELLEQEMRERNKLVKLVKLQAREVEALKEEIGLLRGKDGKVYAPR